MTLPGAIVGAAGQPATLRRGVVVGVNPVQVSVQGVTFTDVGVLSGYTATVGDEVVLIGQAVRNSNSSGSSWLLLGQVFSAADAPFNP